MSVRETFLDNYSVCSKAISDSLTKRAKNRSDRNRASKKQRSLNIRLPTEDAVIANIQYQAQKLAESSTILADLIQICKLKIVGGQYDLRTGKFTIVT
ncbi:hypothetical protein ACJ2PR_13135 [Phormidesmis sp. 146-33]